MAVVQVEQHNLPVSRTTVETDRKIETRPFKTGKPIAYTSSADCYIEGTLFKAGEVFVTGMPKGSTWEEVDPVERAAADAGKQIKDDVNLEAMNIAALQAHAVGLGVNLGEAKSKADIITVIKARDEPTL